MKRSRVLLVRWLVPAAAASLAIASLFLVYRDLSFETLVAALAKSDPRWFLPLAAAVLVEQIVRSWKWRLILREVKPVSWQRLLGAIFAGSGLVSVVPLPLNPLVRSWLIARLDGLSVATVLTTVAVDRYVDAIVFALFGLFVTLSGLIAPLHGEMRLGLTAAALVQLIAFSGFALGLFGSRPSLDREDSRVSRILDWLARQGGRRFEGLRLLIREGIVWPHEPARRAGVIGASVLMKLLAATQFLWAGLAFGIVLGPLDCLFMMVFSGFALIAARFLAVPAVYFFACVHALALLGVPAGEAFAMLLFIRAVSIVLMVGAGAVFLWQSGIEIRQAHRAGLALGAP